MGAVVAVLADAFLFATAMGMQVMFQVADIAVVVVGFPLVFLAAAKRDSLNSTSDVNATASLFMKPTEPILNTDLYFIVEQEQSLVSWDHVAGELKFAWAPDDFGQDNTLHDFYPRCEGFVDNQVIDNQGNKFALDYWTPNGTGSVYVPSEKFVQVQWLKEISEDDVWDCRDRYDELPPDVPRPTPKVLTDEQKLDIKKAKELKLLYDCDRETWVKMMRGQLDVEEDDLDLHLVMDCNMKLPMIGGYSPFSSPFRRSTAVKSYFSTLPANDDAVAKCASDGADVLIRSMYADDVTGKEQARILHSAMSSILATHHQQEKRSLVRRLIGRSTATADVVMDATVGAVIDAADLKEQKWAQMLAIGAVVRSVRESTQAGTAGKTELQAINKMFDRFN